MTQDLVQLLERTSALSTDEQLELAALLIEQARKKRAATRRKWLDALGTAPYPLTGEDAQTWVTRTRQEGDERERQWGPRR